MELTVANLAGLVRLTFARPREAAQVVLRQPLPMQARWGAIALMAVLSAFLMQGLAALLPPAVGRMARNCGRWGRSSGPGWWPSAW
jgi:hypothetical protein